MAAVLNCEAVRYLNAIASKSIALDHGLDSVAHSALSIISDMREMPYADHELRYLADMISAIGREGHGALLTKILRCAPNCHLCSSLVLCLKVPFVRTDARNGRLCGCETREK